MQCQIPGARAKGSHAQRHRQIHTIDTFSSCHTRSASPAMAAEASPTLLRSAGCCTPVPADASMHSETTSRCKSCKMCKLSDVGRAVAVCLAELHAWCTDAIMGPVKMYTSCWHVGSCWNKYAKTFRGGDHFNLRCAASLADHSYKVALDMTGTGHCSMQCSPTLDYARWCLYQVQPSQERSSAVVICLTAACKSCLWYTADYRCHDA